MDVTPIFFAFHLKRNVWARAYINDLPAYKRTYLGPDSESGTTNDLLVPGKNTLSIEVLQVEENTPNDELLWQVHAKLYEVLDVDDQVSTKPLDQRVIHDAKFPHSMFDGVLERHKRVPFFYRTSFDPGVPLHHPVWLDAPEDDFGEDGTPELRDAVGDIFGALKDQDLNAFLDAFALKLDHYEKAHGSHPKTTADAGRNYITDFFALEPQWRQTELSELHFEPLHGGKVAHVTRLDGGFAMQARCRKDPDRSIEGDILLTKHQGRWQMFA